MKKTLLALSLVGMCFVGCGDKISDDMVKKYEANLNTNFKEALLEIPNDAGVRVNFNDFKCSKQKESVNCVSDALKINIQGAEAITVDKITVNDNGFYNGKATGLISLKDLHKDMMFENLYSSAKFQGVKLSDAFKGMAAMIAMSEPKFSFLNSLANGVYDLDINTNIMKNNEVNYDIVLNNIINKDSLSFKFNGKVLDYFYEITDKLGLRYDVEKQNMTEPNIEMIANLGLTQEDIAKIFSISNVKMDLVMQDLLSLKEVLNSEFEFAPNDFKETFGDIVNEFINNTPHKLNFDIKIKEGFDVFKNYENDKLMLENVTLNVNGKDMNTRVKTMIEKEESKSE
ncbi:JlpA family lipoprotein adhesin [Campylobacter sp. MG1]|uniref:JlpA family lipoprotein adhesin n=1 Tax=Campylobacter sp. MG1 TaxID=2976332 RepID=UPI00226CE6BD|nr:JlpA family lipoprotein adhesin [Campylobacter sp. MG1]